MSAPSEKELDDLIKDVPLTEDQLDALIGDEQFEEQSPVKTFADRTSDLIMQGYYPQVEAGLRQVPRAMGIGDYAPYTEERDKIIKEMEQGKEQNPVAYGAGTVTGIGANVIAPALKFAKLPGAARAAAQIGTNVAQVALQNPGDTEGVVDPLQLPERAQMIEEAVTSPIQGPLMALPAAGPIANAVKPAAVRAFDSLETLGQKSVDYDKLDYLAEMYNKQNEAGKKQLGKFMLDTGLVTAGDKVKDVFYKSLDLQQEIGKKIEKLYEQGKESYQKISDQFSFFKMPGVDLHFPVMNLRDKEEVMTFIQDRIGDEVGGVKSAQKAAAYFDQISPRYPNNPDLIEAHKIKKMLQNKINYEARKDTPDQAAYREMLNYVNAKIMKYLEDADAILDSNSAKELRKLNNEYSMVSDIEVMAKKAAARKEGSKSALPFFLSPAAYGTVGYGAVNAMTGDPLKAVAAGLLIGGGTVANKALEGRGNSIMADVANSGASRLMAAPNRIAIGVDNAFRSETPTQKAKRINEERKAAKGVP